MRRVDQIALVTLLACLTEDRTPNEQQALLSVALATDLERGKFVVTNPAPQPPLLVTEALSTYDPSEGQRVKMSAAQQRSHDALQKRWRPCPECSLPAGVHPTPTCRAVSSP